VEVVDAFTSIAMILLVPSVCAAFSYLKRALIWLPIVGALLNGVFIYAAVYISEETGWAAVAGLFALFWGYALCLVFTFAGWLLRRYRT
jgi:hypothetical protein